jgi:7-carboxy-7-deazaguanine synthase
MTLQDGYRDILDVTNREPEIAKPAKKLPVMEVFGPTVQGEGAMIGVQTYFIRFGLCDYKCAKCDSMHAVDPQRVSENAEWLDQEAIYHKIREAEKPNTTNWLTYSGGNPAIHDLRDLTLWLKAAGWKIAVETQGTFRPEWLRMCDVVTISPKGPGMGERFEQDKFRDILGFLHDHPGLNVKVVVFDQRDLEFAKMVYEIVQDTFGDMRELPLYLSLGNPYPPGTEPDGWDIEDLRNHSVELYKSLLEDIQVDPILSKAIFLPQWHFIVWGNKQGV